MAADVANTLAAWSTSEASNLPTGATAIGTNLDDNFRMIQAKVRTLCAANSVGSAGTTDIGAVEEVYLTITGVTTITALGIVAAGIYREVTFAGALILTHNATSLILPSGANITTVAGDTAKFVSLGSGNWKCMYYMRASGQSLVAVTSFPDGLVGTPGLYLASDTNNGLYKIGTDSVGWSAGGVLHMKWDAATGVTSDVDFSMGNASKFKIVGINPTMTIASGGTFNITPSAAGGGFQYGGTSSLGGSVSLTAGNGSNATFSAGSQIGASAAGNVSINGGGSATGTPGGVTISTGSNAAGTAAGNMVFATGGSIATSGSFFFNSLGVNWLKFSGPTKHLSVLDTSNRPTISAGGGAGPAITGSDNAFRITVGTGGAATSVTVDFNKTWVNAPVVHAMHQGAVLPLTCSTSTTNVQITAATAFTAGAFIDVICMGIE